MPDAQPHRAAPPPGVLSAALSLVSDCVIATDEQGTVTFVNSAGERLIGRQGREAYGLPLAAICPLVTGEDRQPVDVPQQLPENVSSSCTLLAKDGRQVVVEVRSSRISKARGRGAGYVVVLREQAESGAVLEKSRKDLEQFARGAAHDLESPLKAILQLTQLLELKYGEQLGDDARQYIAFISGSVNRMDDLVKGLVHYFEVSAAGVRNAEPVALDGIVASSIVNLRARIGATGATVTHDPLPALEINPMLLSRLFQSVIDNGIHYHGEEAPRVHVGVVRENENWLFSVADNGVGIAPEYQERIFEPFKRLHGAEWPGSGLGLAICRKVLERLGGRIWVASDAGKGATFYFTIPAAAVGSNVT